MLRDRILKVTLRRALRSSFKLGRMEVFLYTFTFREDFVLNLVSVAQELQKVHTAELIHVFCYGVDYVRVIHST